MGAIQVCIKSYVLTNSYFKSIYMFHKQLKNLFHARAMAPYTLHKLCHNATARGGVYTRVGRLSVDPANQASLMRGSEIS